MGHRALLPDFSSILVIYGFSLHLSHFSNNRSGGWGASNKHCALKKLPLVRGTPEGCPSMRRQSGQMAQKWTNSAKMDKFTQKWTNSRKNGQIDQFRTNQSFLCPDFPSLVRICANLSIFPQVHIRAEVSTFKKHPWKET